MSTVNLQDWVGRVEVADDMATPAPLRGLAATLDHTTACAPGDEVPPLWHWTYFLPDAPTSALSGDGHPPKGGFLPPVPLPRRMWAGSQIEFLQPLRVGQALSRRSTVTSVTSKEGNTGPLCFVKVRHEVMSGGVPAIVEDQDIVYRQPAAPGQSAPSPVAASPDAVYDVVWKRRIQPSPVLLFRYSALTFNSHRIHIDREYAQREEGYAGLVVHGPLVATLLLDLVRREAPQARVRTFSFRAMQPLLDTQSFWVCGTPQADGSVRLWAQNSDGFTAFSATALLA